MSSDFPTEDKVRKTRVLVMGAGILGSRVVIELLSAGFRHIVVADGSSVAPADVDGAFFTEDDVGIRGRAEKLVLCIEPKPELHILALRKTAVTMDGWTYDLVFSCSEPYEERIRINDKVRTYHIPLVDGIVSGTTGRVQVVRTEGPCLECAVSERSSARLDPPDIGVAEKVARTMVVQGLTAIGPNPYGVLQGALYIDGDKEYTLNLGVSPICPHHRKEKRK